MCNSLDDKAMLTIDDISATGEGVKGYRQVGYTLGEGGLLKITGKDAAMKSLFLLQLAGQKGSPTGMVYFDGTAITQQMETYQQQSFHLPVLNNPPNSGLVRYWLREKSADVSSGVWEAIIQSAAQFWGILEFLDQPLQMLTPENWQKVRLSSLMVRQSSLWLLDQPMQHLEGENLQRLLNMIASYCDAGGMAVVTMVENNTDSIPFGDTINLDEFTLGI